MKKHLLVGCSFTDPQWQDDIPWSSYYDKKYCNSYIIAAAGIGWAGICTEAYIHAQKLDFEHCIIMLPTLWRMDIELDHEGLICNSMVHVLENDKEVITATRKWLCSGGLNYKKLKGTEFKIIDMMYKYKGFLPLLREHVLKLKLLISYLKTRNIKYTITAIQDPMHQLTGLDYIKDEVTELLESVEYKDWLRFNGKFIDEFVGHTKHPTTQEHKLIGDYIWENRST